jgi:hypothetical protein
MQEQHTGNKSETNSEQIKNNILELLNIDSENFCITEIAVTVADNESDDVCEVVFNFMESDEHEVEKINIDKQRTVGEIAIDSCITTNENVLNEGDDISDMARVKRGLIKRKSDKFGSTVLHDRHEKETEFKGSLLLQPMPKTTEAIKDFDEYLRRRAY